LFTDRTDAEKEIATRKLRNDIAELESKISLINAKYNNSFEWRFEFPEVLDDEGNFTGFDVVIGNPPYIRQEELGRLKDYLKDDYKVFAGTADILVYFYELGLRVLKPNGKFSFITSNKFMRAGYGVKLRSFLGNYHLDEIIDFGDAPVFGGIAAYASIVSLQKIAAEKGTHQTQVYSFPTSGEVSDFETAYKTDGFKIKQKELTTDSWRLERTDILDLLAKLRSKGKPLGEYVNGRFYRGVVTGLNEAFVINSDTKNRLIAEDAKSAELIKPYIRGRDVKRWKLESQDLWLCFVGWHFESEKYPAIFNHLKIFENQLKARPEVRDGKVPWFAMSRYAADYWQEFEKPKIILGRFMNKATFAFDKEGFFNNDALYMIPDADEFVVAILNSSISWWFLRQICTDLQNGYIQAFRENLFQIPIPKLKEKDQQPFAALVDQILELKKQGKDVQALEKEIDRLVYRLYGLTDEEIAIVEGKQ
jgi:type I restriction-modification system DNA methylase subunit